MYNDYQNGFIDGQNARFPDERTTAEYNELMKINDNNVAIANKYIKKNKENVAIGNELVDDKHALSDIRKVTREIAIDLAEGKTVLMKPPVDRGAKSQLNYTVLQALKQDYPESYQWLTSGKFNDPSNKMDYGLA